MKHPKSYDTTPETSRRMAHVHLKQGKAEVLLAKRLWHLGFRYRLNDKRLPGSPDIAILRAKDWYPIHFWEKEILKDTDECIETIQELAEQQIERSIDCRNE